jgi:acetylornithine deacetylase/succinyl-diaminopimelate desuccinylase-like protein
METYIEELTELVAFKSVSNAGYNDDESVLQGRKNCLDYVKSKFESLGFDTKIFQEAGGNAPDIELGAPAIFASLGSEDAKLTVLLYAHYDVQPVQDFDSWKTDPFDAKIVGERMFGRGAADDKAGIVCHIEAIRRLIDSGNLPNNLRIKIFIEGEEEIGSPSMINIINAHKEELQSDIMIITDSENWAVGTPALTTTMRGVSTIDIKLDVLDHPVHSGMFSGPILDANLLLMRLISKLHDAEGNYVLNQHYTVPVVNNEVPDYTDEVFRNDSGLLENVSIIKDKNGGISSKIWVDESVTVIGFSAPAPVQGSNVLANTSTVRVSLRTSPYSTPKKSFEALKKYLISNCEFGTKIDVQLIESGESYLSDSDAKYLQKYATNLKDIFGTDTVLKGIGGSIPLASLIKNTFPGIEIIITGVEDPDTCAHSDNESLHLTDFEKVIESEYNFLKTILD